MKPFINFTFPNGYTYQVPTEIIARHRAENYKDEFGGDVERSLSEDTKPLFEDAYQVADWAKNNMSWAELAPFAILVRFEAADIANQFADASTELADKQHFPPQLRGDTLLAQPVEMLLGVTLATQQKASAILLSDNVSIVVLAGEAAEINGYLAVLNEFTNRLADIQATSQAQAAGSTLVPGSATTN